MQVEHKTEKGTIVFVKIPDNAKAWKNESYHVNTLWYKSEDMRNPKHIKLPYDDLVLIGLTSGVTEEICFNMGFESSIQILDWAKNSDSPIVKEVNGLDEFKKVIKIKNIQQLSVVLFKPNEK